MQTMRFAGDPEARAARLRRSPMGCDPGSLVGPKRRASSWEAAHAAIRAVWPEATRGGSVVTWMWWLPPNVTEIVGEAWPVRGSVTEWWFRVLSREATQ